MFHSISLSASCHGARISPIILLWTQLVCSALLPFPWDLPQILLPGDCHPSSVVFEPLGYAEAASSFPPLPHLHACQPLPHICSCN